ncbi:MULTISPECIES: TIGR02611 family protein [Streptomyces]|uniref:TIGR02611 family protein n=1 Tax=Streptomyces solicathayae TaxID=3081768 RepID=A0ABZ0M141_9ACTN|nr:TIGR02611 family protein [Streptomyces sp. HUAS YS2]WOX25462.1 TIGR02611 family protein [Streptomyces sp. HUAS YS2]
MNAESDERSEAAAAADKPATGDVTEARSAPEASQEEGAERPLGSRAPEFIKARRTLHMSWQVGVFVVGLAVVVAGVIMLPLPGPGWLVIFGGMAIWATEFVWAQLVLRWTKRKVTEAAQKALDPKVRRRNIVLTTIGLVIIAVLLGIYLWKFGFVMPWKIDQ